MDFWKTSKSKVVNRLPCMVTRLPKMGGFGRTQENGIFNYRPDARPQTRINKIEKGPCFLTF